MAMSDRPERVAIRTAYSYPSDNWTRSMTPTADTNGVGSHDPLSNMCALFPQVRDYIGQLRGIFLSGRIGPKV